MQVKNGDFLIYGGLVIDSEEALNLSNRIWEIRTKFKVARDEKLKFNPGPKHLEHHEFIALKAKIIAAAIESGVNFLVYNVLHDVAKDADLARRNGINEICLNSTYILKNEDTCGLVLIDRFNDKGNKIEAHLTEKFSVGLKGLPFSSSFPLERIVGLHYSAIGQSHFPSLIDIVLGSYRFAMNCHCRGQSENNASAKTILTSLAPLFPKDIEGTGVPRIGVSFSPIDVKAPKLRKKYKDALKFLNENGVHALQEYGD